MEHTLALDATSRAELGKKVRYLRKQGTLPIILYGHGAQPTPLAVPLTTFKKVFKTAGHSSLVDVKVGDAKPVKVLIHDVQLNSVTEEILHADLYQVNMTEKVKTEVPLKFVGEAPAVKELEGNLITQKDNLTIEALPMDLIHDVEIDISGLKTFEDTIKVADIKAKIPATVTILDEEQEVIALVTPPRSEEELEAELAKPVDEQAAVADLELKLDEEKAAKVAEKGEGEEGPAETAPVADEKQEK